MSTPLTGDPSTDSHPVTVMLLRTLTKGTTEAYAIDTAAQGKLQESLGRYLTGENLPYAATVVANLAQFMTEKKNSPTAAQTLLQVVETCVVALEARGVDTRAARATLGGGRRQRP